MGAKLKNDILKLQNSLSWKLKRVKSVSNTLMLMNTNAFKANNFYLTLLT